MTDRMSARQRREAIIRHIMDRGRVQVSDLVAEFGLTDTSIRRDLVILEQEGTLRRVRGGAISTGRALQMAAFEERVNQHSAAKQHIGAAAAKYIHPYDVIILDSGTTVLQLARHIPLHLRRTRTLRIVTNSTMLLEEVGPWAAPNLVLLGGIYLPEHRATVGPEMVEFLEEIRADRAFLGCDGLTVAGGITTAHPLIAEAGRMLASRAEQVIVLADHSKLARAGFVPIMPNHHIDLLITDTAAPPEVVEGLRHQGVEVVLVPGEE